MCIRPCKEFESIRIFLSNLGFGSLILEKEPQPKKNQNESSSRVVEISDIASLDASDVFIENLKALDTMPTRIFCNCYIFYVKSGQNDAKSILRNVVS